MRPELTEDGIARWARQLLVPGFGAAGQERLMAARVRVVGADGSAEAALVYLAQAGVGTIWIDDPEVVGPADVGGWLHTPADQGRPRGEAAAGALAAFSRFARVAPYPMGGMPSATLVCATSTAQAVASAEVARRAGVPHVVMEAEGDGGALVTVPVGAPCFACGRIVAGLGRPPTAGAAALAALAAQELLQLIADPALVHGRRIELVRGVSSTRATNRLPGCQCAPARADTGAPPEDEGAEPSDTVA